VNCELFSRRGAKQRRWGGSRASRTATANCDCELQLPSHGAAESRRKLQLFGNGISRAQFPQPFRPLPCADRRRRMKHSVKPWLRVRRVASAESWRHCKCLGTASRERSSPCRFEASALRRPSLAGRTLRDSAAPCERSCRSRFRAARRTLASSVASRLCVKRVRQTPERDKSYGKSS